MATQQRTDVVQTAHGPVRGKKEAGMRQFLGIPYGSPPTGSLRWKPPVPPQPWTDPFEATEYGPICAQNCQCYPNFSPPGDSEDCLHINVYTPAEASDKKRPVIVWIHGGGLVIGTTRDYDPRRLVLEGDAVFVSMDYRLNVFGFFSHPAINAEGHTFGNYGVMDQQLALKWVQENIAAFGGDPSNVTIAGQSAGGMSVSAHLISPRSAGLFHKAICQSGAIPVTTQMYTSKELEADGIAYGEKAGCKNQTAEELRALSTEEVMAANAIPDGAFQLGAFRFWMMEDGTTIPLSMRQKFVNGEWNVVPMLTGCVRDEFLWFQGMIEVVTGARVPTEAYSAAVKKSFEVAPPLLPWTEVPVHAMKELEERYPPESHENASQALGIAIGDSGFINVAGRRAASVLFKAAPAVYAYEFDVPDSPAVWPKPSFEFKSAHCSELQFLFPNFPRGEAPTLSSPQQQLAKQMVQYWTAFLRTGNPNKNHSGSEDLAIWETYSPEKDNAMLLEVSGPKMTNAWGARHHADFWDSHYR